MNSKRKLKRLRLEQLDVRTTKIKSVVGISTFKDGWIRQIREALGISARQLATKIGMAQSTLARIEKGEAERSVMLKTLDRVAEAIDCKVIYAFVPRETFEKFVHSRAVNAAEKLVRRVSYSMDLEDQGISETKRKAQIMVLADELSKELSRDIWENWK